MVMRLLQSIATVVLASVSTQASALFNQTASDIMVLEDTLRLKFEETSPLRSEALPILVATPAHLWKESRDDFAASVLDMLGRVFPDNGSIIQCADCDAWRLNVRDNSQVVINNGELSLAEYGFLKTNPLYQNAKSVAYIKETASGIEFKLIRLTDGRLLHHTLADSTQNLNRVRPFMNYAAERERRMRAESLSYVFVNFGLWPTGLFQLEFMEQWGARNQHLSGIGLSLVNPTLALGGVYRYMLPGIRRLNISGGLYYPLINAIASAVAEDAEFTDSFVAQASAQFLLSNTYAVFAAVSSEGQVSVGLTMFNPLLFPILL